MTHTENSSMQPSLAGVQRRTVIKGAAWSVPVIAAAIAVPAHAASANPPCATLPTGQVGWTLTDPLSGRGQSAGAVNSWRTVDGQLGFRQYNDNFYRRTNPAAVNYVTRLRATFDAVAGTEYVFTFRLLGNSANSPENIVSTMGVVVGGATLQTFSTQPAAAPGTQVPMGPVNATTGSQVYTVSWTAPTSGMTTFDYIFTMYPVGTQQITYNDDIWVSLPQISQPAGCTP
jgi:hypothetical protein